MRSRLTVVLYLSLVFASGVLVGGLGQRLYTTQSVRAARPGPDEVRRQYAEEMRTRLQLRPEQFQKLTTILTDTHNRFRELRRKWAPEVRAIQDAQLTSIRDILDDPQKVEYDKMRQEREKQRAAH